jgi:phosphopantothenoylcysteine decarboxylase/phosphopantothenate--cysteine ligase
MLKGKKILLGISGSIAAYKTVILLRLLIKAGAEVKVVMTPAAKDFVSPLTLSTLSRNPVLSNMFDELGWSNHVMLGRWADLMLITPLSCHTLARMAHGECDNLLLAVYLSATCPVAVAPAMDEDMWKHPATRENIRKIEGYGNVVIPVNNGELASGLVGEGRMAEPEEILSFINDRFFLTGPFAGKKVLVSAGPTYEAIDPVRFIGNNSSGKMGIAIAREFKNRGAEVTLVLGPTSNNVDLPGIFIKRVQNAEEMYQACNQEFDTADLTIMAAAVADYRPETIAAQKIKKTADTMSLELVKTRDVLKSLGERKRNGQVLVGFALETMNEDESAQDKLERKNADLIILNSLNDEGAGFGHDTNKIKIFRNNGTPIEFELKTKKEVAADIADTIIKLFYA